MRHCENLKKQGDQNRALVTGASKGIGQAIAERLAADGAAVAVHYDEDVEGSDGTISAVRTEKA